VFRRLGALKGRMAGRSQSGKKINRSHTVRTQDKVCCSDSRFRRKLSGTTGHRLLGTQRPQVLCVAAWAWFCLSIECVAHTHTPIENNTPDNDTHAHDKNNTPNPKRTPPTKRNNARRWRDDGACHRPRPGGRPVERAAQRM